MKYSKSNWQNINFRLGLETWKTHFLTQPTFLRNPLKHKVVIWWSLSFIFFIEKKNIYYVKSKKS